jgi:dihydroorotase
VGPIGCITVGRRGETVEDVGALLDAGAVAISDDGDGVEDDDVMRAALKAARARGAAVIQHCEYKALSAGGVMHLGEVSRRLGVPGLDPRSEEAMIERDIALSRETGGRYHVAHISTARAVELVRRAKAGGVPVTSEVCTHHLWLTDQACAQLDPNTKMHPPLRPQSDVDACRRGLLDGTIDCIVTDHAPHAADEKAKGFIAAPPGIVGLETALGLAAKAMIETGLADWRRLIEWFTTAPARVLGRSAPSLEPGSAADLTVIDPRGAWTVDPDDFAGKGRNTPFRGLTLPARAVATVRGTRLVVRHA